MPILKPDAKKIKSTVDSMISKLLEIKRQPLSATREDTNFLVTRLQLLEYLTAPKNGAEFTDPQPADIPICKICGGCRIVYCRGGEWYCAEHYPKGVTWPIGMYSDDLKRYKESSNATSDNRVPLSGQGPSGTPEEHQLSETMPSRQPPSK